MKYVALILLLVIACSSNKPEVKPTVAQIQNPYEVAYFVEQNIYSRLYNDYDNGNYLAGAHQKALETNLVASMNRLQYYKQLSFAYKQGEFEAFRDTIF